MIKGAKFRLSKKREKSSIEPVVSTRLHMPPERSPKSQCGGEERLPDQEDPNSSPSMGMKLMNSYRVVVRLKWEETTAMNCFEETRDIINVIN